MDQYDKLYKVIVLGSSSVGKTNLLTRYTKGKFQENSRTTIGVEFGYRDVVIDECRIRLQIWDTAGQERFRATPHAYYRGAHGALLVFDLTDPKSLESLCEEHWQLDLRKYAHDQVCQVLVGNKLDLERQVEIKDALALANRFGMRYTETSAKQDVGVEQLFSELAAAIYERSLEDPISAPEPITPIRATVQIAPQVETKRQCC